MMKLLSVILVCLVAAVPLMYFAAWADPVRESISIKTYAISFLASLGTASYFIFNSKKCKSEQLLAMRNDGLSESEIKSIVGDEKYASMIKS